MEGEDNGNVAMETNHLHSNNNGDVRDNNENTIAVDTLDLPDLISVESKVPTTERSENTIFIDGSAVLDNKQIQLHRAEKVGTGAKMTSSVNSDSQSIIAITAKSANSVTRNLWQQTETMNKSLVTSDTKVTGNKLASNSVAIGNLWAHLNRTKDTSDSSSHIDNLVGSMNRVNLRASQEAHNDSLKNGSHVTNGNRRLSYNGASDSPKGASGTPSGKRRLSYSGVPGSPIMGQNVNKSHRKLSNGVDNTVAHCNRKQTIMKEHKRRLSNTDIPVSIQKQNKMVSSFTPIHRRAMSSDCLLQTKSEYSPNPIQGYHGYHGSPVHGKIVTSSNTPQSRIVTSSPILGKHETSYNLTQGYDLSSCSPVPASSPVLSRSSQTPYNMVPRSVLTPSPSRLAEPPEKRKVIGSASPGKTMNPVDELDSRKAYRSVMNISLSLQAAHKEEVV